MGRQVRRVPAGFDWPVGKTWWGFLLNGVHCETCGGGGKVGYASQDWHKDEDDKHWCPSCEGEGKAHASIDVPEGPAYQLWENTSEGSPISPPFETPEDLARWLADNGASSFGDQVESYATWLAFVAGPGWAPSAVRVGDGPLQSGVRGLS